MIMIQDYSYYMVSVIESVFEGDSNTLPKMNKLENITEMSASILPFSHLVEVVKSSLSSWH